MDGVRSSELFCSARAALAGFSCKGFGDGELWAAGAGSSVLSAGGTAMRPTAILAVSGPSFNARTRTLCGLKNEQGFPLAVPSRQAPGSAFVSAPASLGARSMGRICVLTLFWIWLLEPSAELETLALAASPVGTAESKRTALSGLWPAFSPITPTAPAVAPNRTESATIRSSRRNRDVGQNPPNSG
jgi:hypothetical protein